MFFFELKYLNFKLEDIKEYILFNKILGYLNRIGWLNVKKKNKI